jgi:hypothetical protein
MAANFAAQSGMRSPQTDRGGVSDELGLPHELLDPVLEGARARGVVDAFEAIGQGAVLLDASGSVLHVSSHAERLLGKDLLIAGGHLVGSSADVNHRLGSVIQAALGSAATKASESQNALLGELRIRAIAFGAGRGNLFQLLKAIVLIDRVEQAV